MDVAQRLLEAIITKWLSTILVYMTIEKHGPVVVQTVSAGTTAAMAGASAAMSAAAPIMANALAKTDPRVQNAVAATADTAKAVAGFVSNVGGAAASAVRDSWEKSAEQRPKAPAEIAPAKKV